MLGRRMCTLRIHCPSIPYSFDPPRDNAGGAQFPLRDPAGRILGPRGLEECYH
jgi:hypothetical protein